ncbi:MAG: indolepyruvate oxidoreductase subunit beta family protein [Betaproteobacteria bacterium]|nr:indolepyruvate oxidoreductase subunit beta family protein [Betaproteobacteria bacterium]
MSAPISLLVCALGGEGGGVLSAWLMDSARRAGYPAQSTSIPGVAQRTGATTYYIEVMPVPLSQLGGKQPVFGLNPVPGALDVLLSSELLETARQINAGMVSPERTQVFTSSARSLTTQERMALGDGRWDNAPLTELVHRFSKSAQIWDFDAMAHSHGTLVSAVMLGALAGSGVLPFARAHYEASIQAGAHSARSLSGFAAAYAQIQQAPAMQAKLADANTPTALEDDAGLQGFPAPVRDLVRLGFGRLSDYQNKAYASLYLQRLQHVVALETAADPENLHGFAASQETARWLALWMAFDDIVRVADLKSRASRWQRVAREVRAQADDVLQVYDHFKPGVPEFAALLPNALATPLLRWDRARVSRGQAPLSWALKIGTHSVSGMLALRGLAGMRWLRPWGSRFRQEQADIEQWLSAVRQGLQEDWALGHAVATCGQLIKGYGSTNQRAKNNLHHILSHLAPASLHPSPAWRAQAIDQARSAALQDEAGVALDQQLQHAGAPARPVPTQPLRFVRNAARRP